MGAIIMFSFIMAIAIAGTTYFVIQDKKERKNAHHRH